jgi:hypothetical protein
VKSTNTYVDFSLIGGVMVGLEFLDDEEEKCFYTIIDLFIFRAIISKDY